MSSSNDPEKPDESQSTGSSNLPGANLEAWKIAVPLTGTSEEEVLACVAGGEELPPRVFVTCSLPDPSPEFSLKLSEIVEELRKVRVNPGSGAAIQAAIAWVRAREAEIAAARSAQDNSPKS